MLALRAPVVFDGERFLDGGGTVFLVGSRILGVESVGCELPEGWELREYAGSILPGLIDAHVHLVADGSIGSLEAVAERSHEQIDATIGDMLDLQARAGVTTVRDLGDRDFRTLGFRYEAGPGRPRIVAAGPPLTTPTGHCHYLGGVVADDPAGVVADHAHRGVDLIKVMASGGMLTPGTDVTGVQFTPEQLTLLVRAAHDHGLRVVAHTHSVAGAWQSVRAGVDGLEHFSCIGEHGPATPEALLAAIAEAEITIDPTLGADPSRIPPEDQMPPQLREMIARFGLGPEQLLSNRAEQLERIRAHGIRVVSGLDAGAAPPKPHGALWRAVDQLAASWPVTQALASATSVAAAEMGLAQVTGRLAAGFSSDVLIVDGDLRHDTAALARPVAVLLGGGPPRSD